MKKKVTWQQKFRYWFDNIMARGTGPLVGMLFGITAIVVVVAGLLAAIIDGQPGLGMLGTMWVSLMHAIDAGTLAGDSGNVSFIFLMSIVTVCGIFITSILIGIINSGIEAKMASLRKGKSHVLESDHVVILGFNEGVFTILSELVEANANQSDAAVVIMDDLEKEVMEDVISRRIPCTKTTRIICRSGKYTEFSNLEICSIDTCKSVIIQAREDFVTIKALLAVTCLLKKCKNEEAYIAAVIQDEENLEAAKIAGEGFAEILYLKNTISRIMAHTCRQPGLSTVFTELFDYGGGEIYIEKIDGIQGRTMAELPLYFPISTVMGIHRDGVSMLNPPSDTIVKEDDALILLAEDDGVSVAQQQAATIDRSKWSHGVKEKESQGILILGSNEFLPGILMEADAYVSPGTFFVVATDETGEHEKYLPENFTLKNVNLQFSECDIFNKGELEGIITEDMDSVLILSSMEDDPEKSDAKTLLLLLQLKEIQQRYGYEYSVTSEMRMVENQELAQITGVNDFVISSNITNLMLTQISQTRELKGIFEELLVAEGSEIYMKPVEEYVVPGQPIDLYTVAASVAEKSEVFMGYRKRNQRGKMFEIFLNRNKEETVIFEKNDSIIVLAVD